jgi:hypothetical protein
LKALFVPDTDFMSNCIEQIKNEFMVTFGISDFDVKLAFGSEAALSDISVNYNNPAFHYSGNIVNMSYVIKAISTFRPYIRGFICLLLFLYNINQFMGLIGQPGLSLGVLLGMGYRPDEHGTPTQE